MEPVQPPLPLNTPLLLVKPPMGLSTPTIFKALDLSLASSADPRELLRRLNSAGMSQDVCINDLERPAFLRCTPTKCLHGLSQRSSFDEHGLLGKHRAYVVAAVRPALCPMPCSNCQRVLAYVFISDCMLLQGPI